MEKTIAELEKMIGEKKKETPVWKKVPLKDDESIWYVLEALEDFSVQGHSVKKGERSGRIHNTSTIGEYSWVTSDSRIGDDCEIGSNVLITEDSIVGNTKILYRGSRVRHSCIQNSQFIGELMAYHSDISSTTVLGDGNLSAEKSTVINSVMVGSVNLGSCTLRDVTVAPVCSNHIRLSNAQLKSTIVGTPSDFIVFKNWWSSGRYFTYSRYTNMWCVGCFYGTGEELIKKAYNDSKVSGREYERIVRMVEEGNKDYYANLHQYNSIFETLCHCIEEPGEWANCGDEHQEEEQCDRAAEPCCEEELCGCGTNCCGH